MPVVTILWSTCDTMSSEVSNFPAVVVVGSPPWGLLAFAPTSLSSADVTESDAAGPSPFPSRPLSCHEQHDGFLCCLKKTMNFVAQASLPYVSRSRVVDSMLEPSIPYQRFVLYERLPSPLVLPTPSRCAP